VLIEISSIINKKEANAQVHLERFNHLIKVLENYCGNIGTDNVFHEHDELFEALSETEKAEESNIESKKERAKQQFLAYGLLFTKINVDMKISLSILTIVLHWVTINIQRL